MKKAVITLVVGLSLSACVTINIYFPAAAAEKAADKIIDDVWRLQDAVPAAKKEEAAK
ncbi:hypothetical protein MCEZLEM10_01065 [Methylophilaceae bacterium]